MLQLIMIVMHHHDHHHHHHTNDQTDDNTPKTPLLPSLHCSVARNSDSDTKGSSKQGRGLGLSMGILCHSSQDLPLSWRPEPDEDEGVMTIRADNM